MSLLLNRNIYKLLVGTSAIYLALLPFGFPHIMFLVGLFMVIGDIYEKKIYSYSFIWLGMFLLFGLYYLYRGSDWKTLVNNITSMMMLPIIVELLRDKSKKNIFNLSYIFIKWTTIAFTIECIIRYIWINITSFGSDFYRYKFHSIFFQDTNFLGLALLVVIFFIKYLNIFYFKDNLKKYYYICCILLFLSISRAAILGWIVGEILFLNILPKDFTKKILLRVIIIIIISFISGTIIYSYLCQDPSFKSKLYILELAQDVLIYLKYNKLFGVGYGNSEAILGIFPHNSIFLYYIETGILGLSIKIIFWLFILYKTKLRAIIILLPYLIGTMSATGYATHYLYVICGIIILLTKQNKHNENINFNTNI